MLSAVCPTIVDLGTSGNYAILTKAGISTTGVTSVTGNMGVSPAAATYITGFGLILPAAGAFSTSSLVVGNIYAPDYADPTPANLTTAVDNMHTAYTTANGLTTYIAADGSTPTAITELYEGDISGRTLAPALYKWSTGLLITDAGVTLSGGPNDTWVFQIAQNFTVNNGAIIHLSGGAKPENIFWIVKGEATLGTGVNFSGIILSKTLISLNTGTTVNGRLLAQTAVTLDASTVTEP
ncbi:MAG: ice-binding family protein [Bacteroidales bacterium]|nr:ice-binding family protein [Bacteroidales bacterium]